MDRDAMEELALAHVAGLQVGFRPVHPDRATGGLLARWTEATGQVATAEEAQAFNALLREHYVHVADDLGRDWAHLEAIRLGLDVETEVGPRMAAWQGTEEQGLQYVPGHDPLVPDDTTDDERWFARLIKKAAELRWQEIDTERERVRAEREQASEAEETAKRG